MDNSNKPKPTTTREAKIWYKYSRHPDWDWRPIWEWPTDLQRAVMRENLNYTTRFRLFVYFVGNGMDPRQARDIVISMCTSAKDKEHVRSLFRDLLKKGRDWTYWDEHNRAITKIDETMPLSGIYNDRLEYGRGLHNRAVIIPSIPKWKMVKDKQAALFESDSDSE